MTRIDDEFGEALRIARQAADVTQEDLSTTVGGMGIKLSQATIGKIERGERKVTVGEAEALSRALNLYNNELVRGISATSAHVLHERLDALRDELKQALHAFESGQTLVASQARNLDPRAQYELKADVLESIEDVVDEYRREQTVGLAAMRHQHELDGLPGFAPLFPEMFMEDGKTWPSVTPNAHAVELVLGERPPRRGDG